MKKKKTKTVWGNTSIRYPLALCLVLILFCNFSHAAWPTGQITVTQIGGDDCSGTAGLALDRADLALLNGDQENWAQHMAQAIRDGCSGDQIGQRINAAQQTDAISSNSAAQKMLAAVTKDRPEVLYAGNQSAGRALDQPRTNVSGVVSGLIDIMNARKTYLDNRNKPLQRASIPDATTQRVYRDIFADGQRQSSPASTDQNVSAESLLDIVNRIQANLPTTDQQPTATLEPSSGITSPEGVPQTPHEATVTGGGSTKPPESVVTDSNTLAATPSTWEEQVEQIKSQTPKQDEFDLGELEDF